MTLKKMIYILYLLLAMPFIVIILMYYNEMESRKGDVSYQIAIKYLKNDKKLMDARGGSNLYYLGFTSQDDDQLDNIPISAYHTIFCLTKVNNKRSLLFIEINLIKNPSQPWKVTEMKIPGL